MATDPRDYRLDISGMKPPARNGAAESRPFLRIHFACCNVYSRIYRNSDESAYEGRCPKCARPIKFVVGQGGTDQRFFVVE
jgi:hypothetical protein